MYLLLLAMWASSRYSGSLTTSATLGRRLASCWQLAAPQSRRRPDPPLGPLPVSRRKLDDGSPRTGGRNGRDSQPVRLWMHRHSILAMCAQLVERRWKRARHLSAENCHRLRISLMLRAKLFSRKTCSLWKTRQAPRRREMWPVTLRPCLPAGRRLLVVFGTDKSQIHRARHRYSRRVCVPR